MDEDIIKERIKTLSLYAQEPAYHNIQSHLIDMIHMLEEHLMLVRDYNEIKNIINKQKYGTDNGIV